jgi:DNA-binding IclR family transcriptional regulator
MKSKNTQNSIYKVQSLERALDIPYCFNIDKREGDGMLRISSNIGCRRPLHYDKMSRIFMAHLDPGDVPRILKHQPLEPHTPYSISSDLGYLRL